MAVKTPKMLGNKKGIFFTIMAIIVVAFLFSSELLITRPATVEQSETSSARTRIAIMDNYLDSFEAYAGTALRTSGYFVLQNLSKGIADVGDYVYNMNATLRVCIITSPIACLAQGETFQDSLNLLVDLAQTNMSITTAYIIHDVWITEEQPMEVVLWLNFSYNVSDPFASWAISGKTIRTTIDVTSIQDPAYAYQVAQGELQMSRAFNLSQLRKYQFNAETFGLHYENRTYIIAKDKAPSVIDRYMGNLQEQSSCCGIESVVHYDEISPERWSDPSIANLSYVDYYFFTQKIFDCEQNKNMRISNHPDQQVRLDTESFSNTYNLTADDAIFDCTY